MQVDVDEADVAVLTQNLARSKDAFHNITRLLRTISQKTHSGSTSIRPILAQFNALTAKKASVDEGLALLHDVSGYLARAADAQRVLSGPIEAAGIQRYVECLESLAQLLRDMKRDIRDFEGVVIGFANTVDRAEMNVVKHLSEMLGAVDLASGEVPRAADIGAELAYFARQGRVRNAHAAAEKALYAQMCKHMAPHEAACTVSRHGGGPYEKGTLGVGAYAARLLQLAAAAAGVCEQLQLGAAPPLSHALCGYLNNRLTPILAAYNTAVAAQGVVPLDMPLLELLDALRLMDTQLAPLRSDFARCPSVQKEYARLTERARTLLVEWVKYVDARVAAVERFNELSIPEVIVEVVSKVRRVCEFESLAALTDGRKLGSWLDTQPPLRFMAVYTSVIPGAEASAGDRAAFLTSSFVLDLIDELMVNIEIYLREQAGESGMRKLAQGFLLVKNVVMIETIVNRLAPMHRTLGAVGLERLLRLKNRFLKLFLDDWNYASYIIIRDMTQITTTNAMNGGQMSTREKDQTKELFKNFNESFDEALKQYEKFNVQEKDLRVYLSGEIKKLIINAYNKLYDKYGSGDFTKNRSKYIKYDKLQFERLLTERL